MTATFEVKKDAKGEFRWTLRHQNGNIIADCAEGYTTKEACMQGLESVKTNVVGAQVNDMTA